MKIDSITNTNSNVNIGEHINIGEQVIQSEDFKLALDEVDVFLQKIEEKYPNVNDISVDILKEELKEKPELLEKLLKGIKAGGFEALKTLINNNPVATFFITAAQEVTS